MRIFARTSHVALTKYTHISVTEIYGLRQPSKSPDSDAHQTADKWKTQKKLSTARHIDCTMKLANSTGLHRHSICRAKHHNAATNSSKACRDMARRRKEATHAFNENRISLNKLISSTTSTISTFPATDNSEWMSCTSKPTRLNSFLSRIGSSG